MLRPAASRAPHGAARAKSAQQLFAWRLLVWSLVGRWAAAGDVLIFGGLEVEATKADSFEKDPNVVEALACGISALSQVHGDSAVARIDSRSDTLVKVNYSITFSEERRYRIDNSVLQANAVGLGYRSTKTLGDKADAVDPAKWDTTVEGVDEGDGWLKVGQYYLPMAVGDSPVVILDSAATNNATVTYAATVEEVLANLQRATNLDASREITSCLSDRAGYGTYLLSVQRMWMEGVQRGNDTTAQTWVAVSGVPAEAGAAGGLWPLAAARMLVLPAMLLCGALL